ncbi:hypothetical protein GCM10025870_11780 [Agromyces marinus]|uniref:Uncharacterized protein n=1 Tax=Agromyces marinus TaxID=1389020 RepID=A0ABM8H023_9MICO|nr:hypothetical protein GCM10025870_11780 [Agromyces marinus]
MRVLARAVPTVRIVVTGRAEARELDPDQHPLGGLEGDEARTFLERALQGMQVSPTLVDEVAGRVSGNPLSLRLAAELMRREGEAVLASPRGRRRLLFGLTEERVQGILYRRILDHVDPAIRPLANPGLVVRRITPGVIRQVLAGPCGLGEVDAARASDLFARLSREVTLVREVGADVIIHRADVRTEMLPLLEADAPEQVAAIHRSAVEYYAGRAGPDDRTERLYHRLMLGDAATSDDEDWDPLAAAALEPALPEFPPASRVELASRLDEVEVDPDDLAAAESEAWVRQFVGQARSMLDAGDAAHVVDLIERRPDGVRTLTAEVGQLHVEALAAMGLRAEATEVAREAIAAADAAGDLRGYVELSIVAARVAEDGGDFVQALDSYLDARESAVDLGVLTVGLTAGAGALRVVRRGGMRPDARIDALRTAMVSETGRLTESDKARNPSLLRELAADLSAEAPGLLADAAEYAGVEADTGHGEALSPEARSTIRRVSAPPPEPDAAAAVPEPDAAAPVGPVTAVPMPPPADPMPPPADPMPPPAAEPMPPPPVSAAPRGSGSPAGERRRPWRRRRSSAAKGKAVSDALRESPEDEQLQAHLREYWRSEADQASYPAAEPPPGRGGGADGAEGGPSSRGEGEQP